MKVMFTSVLAIGAICWLVTAAMATLGNGLGNDIVRQWVVCQYVNSGINPYPLARDILMAKYGAGNPGRAKVHAIPIGVRFGSKVISDIGPPEATYPPPAVGLLALTVGLLKNPATVIWVWFAVNVAALGGVTLGLAKLWPIPPGDGTTIDNLRLMLLAMLLFSAAWLTFLSGQFSLLILGLLLAAGDTSLNRPLRGLSLGIALLKPSFALPFVFIPLVRREWRVLLVAVGVQVTSTAYVAARTGATFNMFRDWLTVSSFFLQDSMYNLQEWLNVVSPHVRPWLVSAVSIGALGLCAVTLAVARKLPPARLFSLAAVTSVFWTYHAPYDFVVLIPVLLPQVGWSDKRPANRWKVFGVGLFVMLALALPPAIIGGQTLGTKILRWAARIVVIWLYGREYVTLYRCVLQANTIGHRTEGISSRPGASPSVSSRS